MTQNGNANFAKEIDRLIEAVAEADRPTEELLVRNFCHLMLELTVPEDVDTVTCLIGMAYALQK